jgi:hypothetical protein
MDKVKEVLANVQKYHFWILCALVVIVGFISWYLATSSLDRQTADNANKIKTRDSEIQTVNNTPEHPNANFLTGMDNLITPFSAHIARAWDKRYEQQKSLLIWPASMTKLEGFLEQVNHLRPIETVPFPTPPEKEIDNKYLDTYRHFITGELPRLAEIIGAKWYVQAGESSSSGPGTTSIFQRPPSGLEGPGGGLPGKEVDNSIVIWNEANQKQILENHFPFASTNGKKPTTLEVLYAQEDLWVFEAIMRIIKKTNGNADANYNAHIKEISSIQIGPTARGRMGKIMPVQLRQTASATGPGGTAMPPTSSPPASTPPTQATEAERADPAFERYVDVDYNPLPVATLRNAATSTDPKIAIYAVAKRIPVRMRLFMDQRYLSDLLAHCGNFNLPIEVRQVRINCPEGLQSDDAQLGGGAMLALPPGGESGRGSMMLGPPSSTASSGGKRKRPSATGGLGDEAKVDPNEIEVEVYGIVYIFNPVNETQLGVQLRRAPEANNDKSGAPVSPTAAVPAIPANTRS